MPKKQIAEARGDSTDDPVALSTKTFKASVYNIEKQDLKAPIHWACCVFTYIKLRPKSTLKMYPLVNSHNSGKSQCSIGNTSSIRVHFPASYVS